MADPLWGGKVTGKIGANAVGVFVTQDRINNLLFPANQGTGMGSLDENVLGGVFRFRRDVGRNSTVGFLYTGRVGDGLLQPRAGRRRFPAPQPLQDLFLAGPLFPDRLSRRNGRGPGPGAEPVLRLSPCTETSRHDSRNLIYVLSYQDLGRDFRADFGFMPRVDTRQLTLNIHPQIWGRPGGWFDRLAFQVVGSRVTDHDGHQTDIQGQAGIGYEGPLQSILQLFLISQKILYQGVEIERTFNSGYLEMKPRSGLWYWLYWEAGDAIDYANARAASSVLLNPSLEIALGRHLNLNVNHTYENLTLKGRPHLPGQPAAGTADLQFQRPLLPARHRPVFRHQVQPRPLFLPGRRARKGALHPAALFLQDQSADRTFPGLHRQRHRHGQHRPDPRQPHLLFKDRLRPGALRHGPGGCLLDSLGTTKLHEILNQSGMIPLDQNVVVGQRALEEIAGRLPQLQEHLGAAQAGLGPVRQDFSGRDEIAVQGGVADLEDRGRAGGEVAAQGNAKAGLEMGLQPVSRTRSAWARCNGPGAAGCARRRRRPGWP